MTSRWSSLASGFRRAALLLLGAIAWETVARSGLVSPLIVPSLTRIGYQLWLLATQPESLAEVWYSVARSVVKNEGVDLDLTYRSIPPD